MIEFITILAWVFGIASLIFTILRIISALTYSELERLADRLNNREVTFPITIPLCICIVCFAWLWTFGFK